MTLLQAIILGIVQGLTEFLPVSSSGHLVLVKELLDVSIEDNISFQVAVHAGTLLAVLIFYRVRLLSIIRESWRGEGDGRKWILWLVVGTIPAALAYVIVKDHLDILFSGTTWIGIAWLFTAALLYSAERFSFERFSVGKMGFMRVVVIGIAQAVALIPGVSRSGSTISAALLMGVKRKSAIDFSFILSLPAVGGGVILKMPEWLADPAAFGLPYLVGGLAAFATGYLAIAIMLKVVTGGKLGWFALYCLVLGIIALVV